MRQLVPWDSKYLWSRCSHSIGLFYDDGPRHHAASKFYGFNEGQTANGAPLGDEFEPGWGYEVRWSRVTWLNPSPEKKKGEKQSIDEKKDQRAKEFKEVQLAYMTVSAGDNSRC